MADFNGSSFLTDDSDPSSFKALPLINKTSVFLYTFHDLLKPGPQDVLQSTLPFYHLIICVGCLVQAIILTVYIFKFVYYEVSDPYATPLHDFSQFALSSGSAPPWEKRMESSLSAWNLYKVLDYINGYAAEASYI